MLKLEDIMTEEDVGILNSQSPAQYMKKREVIHKWVNHKLISNTPIDEYFEIVTRDSQYGWKRAKINPELDLVRYAFTSLDAARRYFALTAKYLRSDQAYTIGELKKTILSY